jgi:ornithine decarboxylase
MTPQAAMNELVRNNVEFCRSSKISGRIAATLALVYPPGIGVVVPGERYDERALPMLDYFRMFEEGGNRFPGFENEIQGIYRKEESRRDRAPLHVRRQRIAAGPHSARNIENWIIQMEK